ncbi:MAG: hypothetical protein EDM05_023700 [Leptolyngbya sp. IPPAS B-1204]
MIKGSLKILHQTLAPLHPGIRPFDDPPSRHWDKPCFPWAAFSALVGLEQALRGRARL